MTAHIHAARMAEYAQDALETDEPWLRWEVEHKVCPNSGWFPLNGNPTWERHLNYRRKPRTIYINGHEVPEPMREAPASGVRFWVPTMHAVGSGTLSRDYTWSGDGDSYDTAWLARGLCHSTREAAEAHARALLSFTVVRS